MQCCTISQYSLNWSISLKKASFPKRRHTLGTIAIRHLEDKTSSVRRYAVRVLTKLIQTHPYTMYGGLLDMDEWKERYEELQSQLSVSISLQPLVVQPCAS